MARKARRNSNPLAGLEREAEKLRKAVLPALPIFREVWEEVTRDLWRDAFVCHVVQGILANSSLVRESSYDGQRADPSDVARMVAQEAFRIADALMEERARRAVGRG